MKTLKITSEAFEDKGIIPPKYTCDGDPLTSSGQSNINPPLEIEGVPEGAKSLVLIMDDPDIPDFVKESRGIEVFDHWIVFNVSPTIKNIEEGIEPEGVRGVNSSGQNKYTGPCPPDKEHRYFFKVYALDTTLGLSEGSSKKEVEKAMAGHIIASGELMGRYDKAKR